MFKVEVWGRYACFTRPEHKAERLSYEVMTPSAAKGIMGSIYWHPGIDWVIDSIRVCNPIRYTNVMTNEIDCYAHGSSILKAMAGTTPLEDTYIDATENRQQRHNTILKDVRYVISAHFELIPEKLEKTTSEQKITAIVSRRLEKGQCYKQPVFGMREYSAHFRKSEWKGGCPSELKGTKDLGLMLWGLDYSTPTPKQILFHAVMRDGVLTIPQPEERRYRDVNVRILG